MIAFVERQTLKFKQKVPDNFEINMSNCIDQQPLTTL